MDNELIYEYSDELNDDFANNKINKKSLNDNYNYFSKNPFFHLASFLFRYLIAIPVLWFMDVLIFRVRFKNKKVLKKAKKKGYYVYSNHVLPLDPVIPPVMTNPTKFMVILSGLDAFSIHPIVTFLIKLLGAVPTPKDITMLNNFEVCLKKHSMKNYSSLVQKVITLVDFDITADLSLSRQAEILNVNASYLSTLFKKETGTTLTEYVAKKRVEQAAFLLTSTNLQIQTISQNCGIYDVNYFTKLFKKYTGKTPKEYRESSVNF